MALNLLDRRQAEAACWSLLIIFRSLILTYFGVGDSREIVRLSSDFLSYYLSYYLSYSPPSIDWGQVGHWTEGETTQQLPSVKTH